jgi:anti-anti-sigma factor
MIIKREDQANITFLKIFGDINRTEAGELKRTLEKILEEKRIYVVLDMEEISFLGSHTIMTLLRLNREFLASGGGIKLLKPRNVVKKFLSIGRVLELFDRFEARIDAVRSFQKSGQKNELENNPVDRLREVGRQQRTVLLRLIDILTRKGYLDLDEFYDGLNRSSQLVFSIYRRELGDETEKNG